MGETTMTRTDGRRRMLWGAGLATIGGVVWMTPLFLLANLRAYYESDNQYELAIAHRAELTLGWTLFAVGEALVGVGIWMIAQQIARSESGWKARAAGIASWVFLVAALVSAVLRVVPEDWTVSAEDLAADRIPLWSLVLVSAVWYAMSAAYALLAVVLIASRAWPTWLGIVLVVLGVLPLVIQLPMFFWIGAIVFGITAAVRRPIPAPH